MPERRKLTISIDGVTYQVEVGNLNTSPVEVIVNGVPHWVHVGDDDHVGTPPEPHPPAPSAGERATIPTSTAATPAAPAAGHEIRSPMPGDIVEIQVHAGDEVRIGQQICYLEAMKMKSAIRSGRDGVIASVEVSEGQPVAHGDVIVTFK